VVCAAAGAAGAAAPPPPPPRARDAMRARFMAAARPRAAARSGMRMTTSSRPTSQQEDGEGGDHHGCGNSLRCWQLKRLRQLHLHFAAAREPSPPLWSSSTATSSNSSSGTPTAATMVTLSSEQKRQMYHDGFTICRGVVPEHILTAARRRIAAAEAANNRSSLVGHPDLLALLFDSDLRPILTELNGGWERPEDWSWGNNITPAPPHPIRDDESHTPLGELAARLHVDGRRALGARFAQCCDAAGTVSIKPFQNFVFVSCSDQTVAGRGQTHVLPGGHLAMCVPAASCPCTRRSHMCHA
jgi:hypothetical protein